MLHDFNNTPSLEEMEELQEKIPFDTAYSALQTSLHFFRETARCNFRDFGCAGKKKEKVSPDKSF